MSEVTASAGSKHNVALALMLIWIGAMVWLAVASGARHDYVQYLGQWALVLSNDNPWRTDNAYGPLHNLLAYLLPLGPLAPKFAIVAAFLAASFALFRRVQKQTPERLAIFALALPANYLVIGMAVGYGLNDALVAALMIGAVVARFDGRLVLAGLLLGLAVLLKYYPALILPVFALDGRKLRWELIAAAVGTIIAGLVAAGLIWGGASVEALYLGIARGPKLMSILASLTVHPGLVPPEWLAVLIRLNSLCVLGVAATMTVLAWLMRMHWLIASVLTLLAVLTTFKVGHQQFYLPWLCLVAALPLVRTQAAHALALVCLPMALFLSLLQIGYDLTGGYLWDWRGNVGFVATGLAVATVLAGFVQPRPR